GTRIIWKLPLRFTTGKTPGPLKPMAWDYSPRIPAAALSPSDQELSFHPKKLKTASWGPRSPGTPAERNPVTTWQYGKGAQYGLRKSSRSGSNCVLSELREAALRSMRSRCGQRADSL